MKAVVSCLFLFLNFAMARPEVQRIRYAVVGDSYSCGEGASPKESWPALMTQHLNAQGLLVVTIPDFGVTATGPKYSRGRNIHEGIMQFNQIVIEEAHKRGLQVVDIFPVSKKMGHDKSLVSKDGLHPSAKAYAEWEKIIFPVALELLKKQ